MTDLAIVSHIKATDTRPRLTDRQAEILNVIRCLVETMGCPPTRAEIAGHFGFKSANAAEEHLQALARKGYLRVARGIARGLTVLDA